MQQPTTRLLLLALAMGLSVSAWGKEEATFSSASLTPDTALKAAQAALKACREAGFNTAVAVADRGGVTQVMIRDRFAGAHTPQTAMGKAWTAASFRTNTTDLNAQTQAGNPSYGIRALPGVVMLGGGMIFESHGSLVGSIGVSGAPSGADDDRCAKAGIDAIRESLEF
jgi:uncharacterized protein GlcG (DUF336 family)